MKVELDDWRSNQETKDRVEVIVGDDHVCVRLYKDGKVIDHRHIDWSNESESKLVIK